MYIYIYSMNEEKIKIASYVVMFSLHMCSFIFADFQDKPMGAVYIYIYQGRIEGASFTSNDVPEILSK